MNDLDNIKFRVLCDNYLEFERLFEVVGNKLAEILQKSELEMQYMLKRTLLLKKKNQKKNELDKILQTVKNKIEGALKAQNQRFNAETVHLE